MTGLDLSRRSTMAELMDTEPVGFEEFRHCLRDLERINIATLAYRPTLDWLDRLVRVKGCPERPLRVLDVGFGHGDMLRRIARWAERRSVPVRLAGADINPWSARAARLATPPELAIDYHVSDLFALPEGEEWDVIISALFAHHLDDRTLARFIGWMERRAAAGWFINDLHRHPVPYWFVRGMVRVLPINRLVVHDAPVSVARGFTRPDWQAILKTAGLASDGVAIGWYLPFRYGVGRVK